MTYILFRFIINITYFINIYHLFFFKDYDEQLLKRHLECVIILIYHDVFIHLTFVHIKTIVNFLM